MNLNFCRSVVFAGGTATLLFCGLGRASWAAPPTTGQTSGERQIRVVAKPEIDAQVRPEQTGQRLTPVLDYAQRGLDTINGDIRDYTCLLIKRELVEGKLTGYQHMFMKVRHEQSSGDQITTPFSVYAKFLGPARLKGREVLYVKGANNDDVIARRGGNRLPSLTMQFATDSTIAMEGNRYPITEVGIQNLVRRLIEVVAEERQYDECEVKFYRDAKLNGRSCTHIEVTHPVARPYFRYHIARVFVDNELNVPIYFASYGWPKEQAGEPVLFEEYIYTDMKLNVGLIDEDFQRSNPAYGFLPESEEATDIP